MVDVCRYQGSYDVSILSGRGPLTLDRWIVDPAAGKVVQQRLDDRAQEFPRVDERVISRPYRYGYSAQIAEVSRAMVDGNGDLTDTAFANTLIKHDLMAGTTQVHAFEQGRDRR